MNRRVDLSSFFIFRMLGVLCNLIMVNVLFLVTSLPIITIGASLTGLSRVTMKMVQHQDPSIVKDYFSAFKKHFKESTVIWLIVLFGGTFFLLDLYVIFTKIDAQYKLLQIPVWIFLFFIASIFIYGFPLISSYPDKIRSTIKNSILLSISNVPVTIFALIVPLAVAKLAVRSGEWLIGTFSIMLFFGCALLSYIDVFFINRVFIKATGQDPEIIENEFESSEDSEKPEDRDNAKSDSDDKNAASDSVEPEDRDNAKSDSDDKNAASDSVEPEDRDNVKDNNEDSDSVDSKKNENVKNNSHSKNSSKKKNRNNSKSKQNDRNNSNKASDKKAPESGAKQNEDTDNS